MIKGEYRIPVIFPLGVEFAGVGPFNSHWKSEIDSFSNDLKCIFPSYCGLEGRVIDFELHHGMNVYMIAKFRA